MIASIEAGAQSLLQYVGSGDGWQWQCSTLSETPGFRLVTHYRCWPERVKGSKQIIEAVGKYYADAEIGRHCYLAMKSLHDELAKRENAPLAIPKPLFYSAENRLLMLKWIGYRSFVELINSRCYQHYLRLAGKALALLHQLPPVYGQVKTLDDHLSELIMPHPLALVGQLSEQGGRVKIIVDKLCDAGNRLQPQFGPVPLHRDFHLRQLFCGKRKVWLIDWDMYALGDPALDVGNFLVYLRVKIPTQSLSAGAAFLQGYRSLMPEVGEANINLYQALTYLRLACKAFRLKQKDWENRVDKLLTECEMRLSLKDSKS